jgi:hypothetical protein
MVGLTAARREPRPTQAVSGVNVGGANLLVSRLVLERTAARREPRPTQAVSDVNVGGANLLVSRLQLEIFLFGVARC